MTISVTTGFAVQQHHQVVKKLVEASVFILKWWGKCEVQYSVVVIHAGAKPQHFDFIMLYVELYHWG